MEYTIITNLLNYNNQLKNDLREKSTEFLNKLESFEYHKDYIPITKGGTFFKFIENKIPPIPKIDKLDSKNFYQDFVTSDNVSVSMKRVALMSLSKENLNPDEINRIFSSVNLSLQLKRQYLPKFKNNIDFLDYVSYLYSDKETLTKNIIEKVFPKNLTKEEIFSIAFDKYLSNIDNEYVSLDFLDKKMKEYEESKNMPSSLFYSNIENYMNKLEQTDLEVFISKPISEQLKYFTYHSKDENYYDYEALLNYYCDYVSKYKFSAKQINKIPEPYCYALKQMNLSEISTLIEKEMSTFKLKNVQYELKDLKVTQLLLKTQDKQNEIYENYYNKINFPAYVGENLDEKYFTKEKILKMFNNANGMENQVQVLSVFLKNNFDLNNNDIEKIFDENKEIFNLNFCYLFLYNGIPIKKDSLFLKILDNINYDSKFVQRIIKRQIISNKVIKNIENKFKNDNKMLGLLTLHQNLPLKNHNNYIKYSDNVFPEDLLILYNHNYVVDRLNLNEYEEKVKKYMINKDKNFFAVRENKRSIFSNYMICKILKENNLKVNKNGEIIKDEEYKLMLKEIEKSNVSTVKHLNKDFGLSI